jgi:putative membrane protein
VDPKLLFWCAALANLGAIVLSAATGVRAVRRGDVRTHRRRMLTSAALVGLFLVAYLLKVALLGREDRSLWSGLDRAVLYVHELCVAAMLGGGGYAAWRALAFRARLGPALALPRDGVLPGRELHRRAGWVAVVGAALAFVTAGGVLAGMFARTAP